MLAGSSSTRDGVWSGPLLHDPTAEAPAAVTGLTPPDGLFLLARVGAAPARCVGVRTLSPGIGEIKRMFVRPAFRGRGIGWSLLAAVEAAALELGHTSLRLDTMEELAEARRLYADSGYVPIAPTPQTLTSATGWRKTSEPRPTMATCASLWGSATRSG